MRAPTVAELLSVWERSVALAPARRALALLAVGDTDDAAALARLPIGRRDARLFALRDALFGAECACLAACPACGETAELTFDLNDLRIAAEEESGRDEWEITTDDCHVRYRLPTSEDLCTLSASVNVTTVRSSLLRRCVVRATHHGKEISAERLPENALAVIGDAMAHRDPQAVVELALACPACEHRWTAPFDILGFLWSELNAWGVRMLQDVHDLAAAYHWSESEILNLHPLRRQAYLELIRA